MVKWNLCLRPLNVMKDCPGKLRVVISQYGFSYSPGGHSHIKPPASRFTHRPPFLHTPGTHRPDEALTSQWSPAGGNQRKKKCSRKLCCLYCSIWILQYLLEPKSLLMPVIILSAELNEDGSAIWMNNDLSSHIPPIDYRSIYPTRHAIILPSENKSSSSDRNPLVATRCFRVQVERKHKQCNSCVSRILNYNTHMGPEPFAMPGGKKLCLDN